MAEISRHTADLLINRHEVTITILLVHRLLNELRVIIETLLIVTPNHLKLIAQRLYELQFCRTTIK